MYYEICNVRPRASSMITQHPTMAFVYLIARNMEDFEMYNMWLIRGNAIVKMYRDRA